MKTLAVFVMSALVTFSATLLVALAVAHAGEWLLDRSHPVTSGYVQHL